MKRTAYLLLILLMLTSFVVIACGPQSEQPDDKKDDKQVQQDDQTTEADSMETPATEGETTDEATDTPATDTAETAAPGTTSSPEGAVSTIQNEDGTVTMIDENGNVIADSTADGTSTPADSGDGSTQTGTGTTSGLGTSTPAAGLNKTSTAGDTPADEEPAEEEPKEETKIMSRGDVNIRDKVAIMKTNFGDLYIFFFDFVAPKHTRNFIYLAEKDFYKDVKFHRIVPGFMAQAGMPRPDWTEEIPPLKLEVDPQLQVKHRRGAISAARTSDPNSATSQFFLVFDPARASHLDGQYTVYGQMFKGFDVLDKIENIKVGVNQQGPGGRPEKSIPLQDIHIVDVVIEDAAPYQAEIDKWKNDNGL